MYCLVTALSSGAWSALTYVRTDATSTISFTSVVRTFVYSSSVHPHVACTSA